MSKERGHGSVRAWFTLPIAALCCVTVSFLYDAFSGERSHLDLSLTDRVSVTELTGRGDVGSALVLALACYNFGLPADCKDQFWIDLFGLIKWVSEGGRYPDLIAGSKFADLSEIVRDVCLECDVVVPVELVSAVDGNLLS